MFMRIGSSLVPSGCRCLTMLDFCATSASACEWRVKIIMQEQTCGIGRSNTAQVAGGHCENLVGPCEPASQVSTD
jgi:hypothetical protein